MKSKLSLLVSAVGLYVGITMQAMATPNYGQSCAGNGNGVPKHCSEVPEIGTDGAFLAVAFVLAAVAILAASRRRRATWS